MTNARDDDSRRISSLGPGTEILGKLVTDEELVILGHVSGEQVRAPVITIGPNSVVRAPIFARSIRIEGSVVGDILAETSVMIMSTATVSGAITCPVITIRDGASVNGGMNLSSTRAEVGAKTARKRRGVAG